jgi:beta-phosphoglucomutase-like phosphatase (HAD superfamily)
MLGFDIGVEHIPSLRLARTRISSSEPAPDIVYLAAQKLIDRYHAGIISLCFRLGR